MFLCLKKKCFSNQIISLKINLNIFCFIVLASCYRNVWLSFMQIILPADVLMIFPSFALVMKYLTQPFLFFCQMSKQLETFKSNLEEFASKHKQEIRKSSQFRVQFQEMCATIGVDPLACEKHSEQNLLKYFEPMLNITF